MSQQIFMTEKHRFLVTMLDGMSPWWYEQNVFHYSGETRIVRNKGKGIGRNRRDKTLIAQNIFSASIEIYLEMESTVRDCTSVINTLNQMCTKIDDLTAQVQIMDKQISERRIQTTLPTSGRAVTSVTNCCANYVETSRPHHWGPDLPFFWKAGYAHPLYAWRSSS